MTVCIDIRLVYLSEIKLDFLNFIQIATCFLFSFRVVLSSLQQSKLTQAIPPYPSPVQADEGQAEENGLQISSAFSLNPDTPPGRPMASFNPGRGAGPVGQLAQNGDTGTHNRAGKDVIM